MQRIYIQDLSKHKDEEVTIKGWVDVRRDQGKMIFLDIRDVTGKVQCVVLPVKDAEASAMDVAQRLRSEWVIEMKGKVNARPIKNIKEDVANGDIELEVLEIKVLNEANTPAFDLSTSGYEVNEEVRMKYKYLDLRRDRLQNNIKMRNKVTNLVRETFQDQNFLEIETPLMTNPTSEGSRSYLVPSRLWTGKYYALPQSPQQYKQLLMAAGFERYFQFAKCMRDEDTRGDRQPEFTQMDLEMSFASREEIMQVNESVLIKIVQELYPEKRIQQIPFPVFTYNEVMEKYNSDKPDIREDKNDPDLLAFCWVIDFPFFEKTNKDNNVDDTGEWTFTHNPFSRPKDEYISDMMNKINIGDILTSQYDIALNGYEIGGGSIRNHDPEALKKVLEIMGYDDYRIESNYGHMLKALGSGCPPHGGIAWGFDRLMMILQNEPNIREVMAFPKTGEGKDLLMDAPSLPNIKTLKELGILYKNKKDENK